MYSFHMDGEPIGITVVRDQYGNLKHGTRKDVENNKKQREALDALGRGDDDEYTRLMREIKDNK